MFHLLAMLLGSLASVLFPIFASYKALKTSDPAQLTPWLMYWVVLSCCLLLESWTSFLLLWIPFYSYLRLLFLLYLVLPQTQGARLVYEQHVHPFLEDNEAVIEDFIAKAHHRLKATVVVYIRRAVDYARTKLLGLPPAQPAPGSKPDSAGSQGYTQTLLARFSVPAARWVGAAHTGSDFYNFLASAVSAATDAEAGPDGQPKTDASMTDSDTLLPPRLTSSADKMSFIAAQRERLRFILSVLDRESQEIQRAAQSSSAPRRSSEAAVGDEAIPLPQRPSSGMSSWSTLSKSRSEAEFEQLEADSQPENDTGLRHRNPPAARRSSWMSWAWASSAPDPSAKPPQEE